jgi:hypothetical protein
VSRFVLEGWKHLGKSSNADFYEVERELVAIVPFEDTRDDEKTARESVAFQDTHWRRVGHRGAVVVFMDPVLDQDGGARAVYANETHDTLTTCYALVGEGIFAYATATVFEGLARPGVPTRIFRSFADTRAFIEEMNRARGGAI